MKASGVGGLVLTVLFLPHTCLYKMIQEVNTQGENNTEAAASKRSHTEGDEAEKRVPVSVVRACLAGFRKPRFSL